MGLLTRVRLDPGEDASPAERLEHTLTPLSAGVAVPVLRPHVGRRRRRAGGGELVTDPVVIGVVAGLVRRQADRRARPAPGRSPGSPAPSSTRSCRGGTSPGSRVLAGVGFTVALLVAELSFDRERGRGRQDRGARRVGGRRAARGASSCAGAAGSTRHG